jgi:hypothetical protein
MTSTHCVPVIVIAVLACTKAMAAPPAAHGDVTAHDGVYRIGQPRFQLAGDEAGGLVFRGEQVVAQQRNRVLLGLAGGVWSVPRTPTIRSSSSTSRSRACRSRPGTGGHFRRMPPASSASGGFRSRSTALEAGLFFRDGCRSGGGSIVARIQGDER